MRARWLAIALLLWLAWGFWASALDHPWHLMFESGGQFFSGVARVHIDRGLGFTRGHDWIYNEDNPYEWRGPVALEPRAYGHHPPALGLSLAAVFASLGQSRAVARGATVASHLVSLLLLLLAIPRWTRERPSAAWFAGLVVVLVPISGFFARNVSHEAWLMPWVLLAVVVYLRRVERGGDGTAAEDALVCAFTALASLYDWPGLYLVPILMLFEAGRRRPLSRLNRWLAASGLGIGLALLGHLAWAAPDGVRLLLSGARKRVDARVMGFGARDWLERVWSFTVSDYTRPVLLAAGATISAWAVRLVARRRAGGPAAAFIGIWLAFGLLHVVAFPGGSWVHPYWMFYLMPAIALAAGLAGAELWGRGVSLARLPRRALVLAWLVATLCVAHETLVGWLAVGQHPTGNPFIEWGEGSLAQLLCTGCRTLPVNGSVVAGLAVGGLLLLWLLRGRLVEPWARDAVLLAGLAAILLPLTPAGSAYDAPLRLAAEMLGGQVSLAEKIPWMEMFLHQGRWYFAYPPAVSVLLVPWVALTGGHAGQPSFNTLLILGSALVLHRLLRALDGTERYAAPATIAYVIGTPIVYSAGVGNVWLLMHSEGNLFLLLALYLGFVRRAPAWAGLCLMIAAQCRYATLLAGLAFALLFWRESAGPRRWRAFVGKGLRFALGMLPPLVATLAFQWATLGDPFLSPYTAGWTQWGPHGPDFSTEYFWRNFRMYFSSAPTLLPAFPFLRFELDGQSIFSMSPFFLGIWLARWRLGFVRCFAPAAAVMALFYLFYWGTGFAQYGTRYMQDLYPLLVPLAAAGFARPGPAWARVFAWLVAISVAINLYGAYVMLTVQR